MYWLYLLIFVVTILVPDIFREDAYGLTHESIEELMIFLLGGFSFLFFILKEHQLVIQQKEKEREQRRLQQTAKDLVESYTYIGEVNRKMDLLMQIGAGLSDRTNLTEKHVSETYKSIADSATFLLKADCATLVFFNIKTNKILKSSYRNEKCGLLDRNSEFLSMGENILIKQFEDYIVFCSQRTIDDVRSYLIIKTFDEYQGRDNNNQEILKYLATQALILYSYVTKNSVNCK